MSRRVLTITVLVVVALVILFVCCFVIFSLFTVLESSLVTGVETAVLEKGKRDQTVAVIDIDEVISSLPQSDIWGNEMPDMASRTIRKIEKAIQDDNVKAVLLRVNTPGGEVYATRQIYNKLIDLKESEKSMVVLMEDVAASGGYYISAPADHIVASEMTLTGSIGVIFTTLDLRGLYEKIGVEEIKIVNSDGNLKVLEGLGDEESEGYKLMQGVADDYQSNFVSVVAEGRGIEESKVRELADGRVYSGKQALDNDLVDSLGEQAEAIEAVAVVTGLDEPNIILYSDQGAAFNSFAIRLIELINPLASFTDGLDPRGGIEAKYILQY